MSISGTCERPIVAPRHVDALRESPGRESVLTGNELVALACAASGLTACESGHRMFKATETIKTQLRLARLKLGARNTAHAVAIGLEQGLLEPSGAIYRPATRSFPQQRSFGSSQLPRRISHVG